MTDIFLWGTGPETQPVRAGLARALKDLPRMIAGRDCLFRSSAEPGLLLWEGAPLLLSVPSPVVVFCGGFPEGPCPPLPPGSTVLYLSRWTPPPSLLEQRSCRVISCGLRQTDTLTLSSCTEDSLVISLQRSLRTCSGLLLEPMEIPLALSRPADPSGLLLTAAVCLVLGGEPLLAGLSR